MISNPTIKILCDGCYDDFELTMDAKYPDNSGNNGYYTADNEEVEALAEEAGWLIRDGKHYCCEACAEEDE